MDMGMFPRCVFLSPLPAVDELTDGFVSRRSTLSTKMHVWSQRTWPQHVMAGVGTTVFLIFSIFSDSSLFVFTINTLKMGHSYGGASNADGSNMCKVNTNAYLLVSACAACQGADWIRYDSHRCSLLRTP